MALAASLATIAGSLAAPTASAGAAETSDNLTATHSPTGTGTPYPGGRWSPEEKFGVSAPIPATVTMGDGTQLSAQVAVPTDPATGERARGKFPVILTIDPYQLSVNDLMVKSGYIFASARPRGTGNSRGTFNPGGKQDQADSVRLVNWAANLSGSSGAVGLYGCSYPGYFAMVAAGSVGKGSPVKATYAGCTGGNPGYFSHETAMKGGMLTDWMYFAASFAASVICDPATEDCDPAVVQATRDFWQKLQDNERAGGPTAFDGSFWKEREKYFGAQAARHGIPTLLWSSSQDEAESSAVQTWVHQQNAYAGRDVDKPMTARQPTSSKFQVVIGEGPHGAYQDLGVALEWFDTWIKGKDTGLRSTSNTMHILDMATKRWSNVSTFPITKTYTRLSLATEGRLSPAATTTGSTTLRWVAAGESADVKTFTTSAMRSDTTIGGHMNAVVYARSSNSNLQLVATLSDVAPDGTTTAISADNPLIGSQRALDESKTWRDDTGAVIRPWLTQEKDRYLTPGKTYRFDIGMEPRLFTVKKGHHIRFSLSTHVAQKTCQSTTTFEALGCYYTAPQLKTLPGGVYTVLLGSRKSSHINLPIAPATCLRTVDSAVSPTSVAGYPQATDWSRGSRC